MKELKTAEEVLKEHIGQFPLPELAHQWIIQAIQAYAAQEKGAEYKKGWNDALDELVDNGFINDVIRHRHWQPLPPKP